MVKSVLTAFLLFLLCGGASADGIYGSLIIGQKYVNLDPLNNELIAAGVLADSNKFPNNHWTVGGEGHAIGAKRWVIGGKGYMFWHNRTTPGTGGTDTLKKFLTVAGGVGMGSVGFCVYSGTMLRLFPQVGVGVSSFVVQTRTDLNSSQDTFPLVLQDDRMQITQKFGVITDACLAMDLHFPILPFFGLRGGPMLHAEAGTTWDPVKLDWMRNADEIKGGPELRFFNPYINVGIGIGINIKKDKN